MWELLFGTLLLLIGLATAEDPAKQLNTTKEENNISKRYIVSIPQYNSLLYTNSQVLPTQQLIFGNAEALVNYINSLQLRTSPYSVPNYYVLPQNNFIQTYTPPNLNQKFLPAVPQVPQRITPKQKQYQQVIPQHVVPQVLRQQVIQLKQQAAPQQIVPQVLRQQIVPQVLQQQVLPVKPQVVPQQIVPQLLRQQVVPQQIVPQVLRQQILPQQIMPQQIVPQQLLGQQVITQTVLRPQIVPQQIIPQPVLKQHIPLKVPQQIPAQPESIIPYFQNNIVTPLVQQRIAPLPLRGPNAPLQYQYYQPQPPRSQVVVGTEPYPYEVPPGQPKIPATKHVPVYVKAAQVVPQVDPLPRVHNLIYSTSNPYNPVSYFQGQDNSQPHSVFVNPYLQTSNSAEQVVRIGYENPHLNQDEEILHRGQEGVRPDQPHTVYADPGLFSSENNQAVVRIGYGHPHFDHQFVQQRNDNGPQQIKLDLPQTYGEGESNDYRYEANNRPARTLNVPGKNRKILNKAESET